MAQQFDIKILNEIVNDAFWLSFILNVKRNIVDYKQKELLSVFLIVYGSVFCEEVLCAECGGIKEETNITRKDIADFRNNNLKKCYTSTSKTALRITKEMGTDFNSYTFDIVLKLIGTTIIDTNYRNWDVIKEENKSLLNGIVITPEKWMEYLMPDLYPVILKELEPIFKQTIERINKLNIEDKSYSTYKLFSKSSLGLDDKYYILQRIGLLQTLRLIDSLFCKRLVISIGEMSFDFEIFITKCKAIVLEMLWNDKKQNKSISILNEVFAKNKTTMPDEFYAINRRIRDNIHYQKYHYITSEEYELVRKYQDVYFENIIETFEKHLNLKFGISYEIGLSLAKIQWWASH